MKKVHIYTKNACPYCDAAKRLFEKLNVNFEESNMESNPEERARLSAANGGWRTMPMIFIGDEFIGGFDDTKALHAKGQLLPKIQGS